MSFYQFIQNPQVLEELKEMLKFTEKHLEQHIAEILKTVEDIVKSKANTIFDQEFKFFSDNLFVLQGTYRNTYHMLLKRLTLVQSLIPKLSQPQLEFSPDEQGFLIRLFLASKLSSPKLMTSELEQCMKNLKLMFDTIALTLFRYYRIHQCCPEAFVRSYLCSIGKEIEFYDPTTSGSFFTFDVRREKNKEYEDLRKELFDLAKTFCLETYTMFNQQLSTLGFDKLMTDFQLVVSTFSENFKGSGLFEFAFNHGLFNHGLNKYQIINDLLVSLLTFESRFIEEKQKLRDFSNQFAASLKEILEKIEPIINSHREYETTDFGYADHQPTPRSSYTEPFEDLGKLAELLTAVLKKKCQQNCDCNGQWEPKLDQIVHKPVVMTEDEMARVDDLVKNVSEVFA